MEKIRLTSIARNAFRFVACNVSDLLTEFRNCALVQLRPWSWSGPTRPFSWRTRAMLKLWVGRKTSIIWWHLSSSFRCLYYLLGNNKRSAAASPRTITVLLTAFRSSFSSALSQSRNRHACLGEYANPNHRTVRKRPRSQPQRRKDDCDKARRGYVERAAWGNSATQDAKETIVRALRAQSGKWQPQINASQCCRGLSRIEKEKA